MVDKPPVLFNKHPRLPGRIYPLPPVVACPPLNMSPLRAAWAREMGRQAGDYRKEEIPAASMAGPALLLLIAPAEVDILFLNKGDSRKPAYERAPLFKKR